ncbi:MAG: hypothetical protein LBD90_10335, partial [Bifidobacteriaceae bacterium]|nr:hypothetical protein [Bifidobacteriaceae bacterium]
MARTAGERRGAGFAAIVATSVLWGTTGTAATFAPAVGPFAIGAAALGIGGLLQALIAWPALRAAWPALRSQRRLVGLGALAVAVYPLAFYSSMRLAGVAIGTVVSLGSAPLAAGLVEKLADGRRLGRRWGLAAAVGVAGGGLLCLVRGAGPAVASATLVAVPEAGLGSGLGG